MGTVAKIMAKDSGVPGWAKGIALVAGVLAIGAAGVGTYMWIKRRGEGSDQRREQKVTGKDIKELEQRGIKASHSPSQYETWANNLQEAFNGCGTSNQTWNTVFDSMNNDADVLLLNKAYGVRKHDGCNWEGDFGDFEGTLGQALTNELSGSEIKSLNDKLTKKNITYQY